jgi:hypothetical protein
LFDFRFLFPPAEPGGRPLVAEGGAAAPLVLAAAPLVLAAAPLAAAPLVLAAAPLVLAAGAGSLVPVEPKMDSKNPPLCELFLCELFLCELFLCELFLCELFLCEFLCEGILYIIETKQFFQNNIKIFC